MCPLNTGDLTSTFHIGAMLITDLFFFFFFLFFFFFFGLGAGGPPGGGGGNGALFTSPWSNEIVNWCEAFKTAICSVAFLISRFQ
jgi:hypothetical protein